MRSMTVENAVCETCHALVTECETARKQWNERRAEISDFGLRGKGIDNELRCLQAKFAKSYAVVRTHVRDCERRQSARGIDDATGYESDARICAEFHLPLFSGAPHAGF
jgi:hypothetical protein